MSAIRFNTVNKTADLYGPVRNQMDELTKNLCYGILYNSLVYANRADRLALIRSKDEDLMELLRTPQVGMSADEIQRVMLYYKTAMDHLRIYDPLVGDFINHYLWRINRIMQYGNDVMKISVLIHLLCENFSYFLKEDYKWVVSIINQGIDLQIFKQDDWKEVLKLFTTTKSDVIVLSYTGTASFPTPELFDCDTYESSVYYRMSHKKQWDACLNALLKEGTGRISPKSFTTIYRDYVPI